MSEESKIYNDLEIVFDKERISDQSHNFDLNAKGYKCGEILISYFQNLESDEKKGLFTKRLLKYIMEENLTFLCFYVGYNLGDVEQILFHIEKEIFIDGYSNSNLITLFENNINNFNPQQLSSILEIINNFAPKNRAWQEKKDNLRKQVIELRFNEFERHIKGINIEINRDKQTVQEYLRDFGFDQKYNITLNKLDAYIQSEQGEGEIVPGGVIGILREFFKNFYIDLALKLAELNGLDEIPRNKESKLEVGHARHYIEKEFQLSSDEYKLLDAYKDICNNSGSHALLSEKKYLRLTRNIGIEILLFVLEKFNDQKINKEKE